MGDMGSAEMLGLQRIKRSFRQRGDFSLRLVRMEPTILIQTIQEILDEISFMNIAAVLATNELPVVWIVTCPIQSTTSTRNLVSSHRYDIAVLSRDSCANLSAQFGRAQRSTQSLKH